MKLLTSLTDRIVALAEPGSRTPGISWLDTMTRRGFTTLVIWLVGGVLAATRRSSHPLGRAQCAECALGGGRCGTCSPDPD